VNARSKLKNQIHQSLAICCIKLSSVISDSFGKSGRHIIEQLLEGKTIEQIIAEMGDYRDFQNADKLAMYFGIAPAVYQSACKLRTGKITKHGSKHMRQILVQVSKAISKIKKSSKLKRLFQRVLTRGRKEECCCQ